MDVIKGPQFYLLSRFDHSVQKKHDGEQNQTTRLGFSFTDIKRQICKEEENFKPNRGPCASVRSCRRGSGRNGDGVLSVYWG